MTRVREYRSVPFGFACYEGHGDPGETVSAVWIGLAGSEEDAAKWCDGDDSVRLVRMPDRMAKR